MRIVLLIPLLLLTHSLNAQLLPLQQHESWISHRNRSLVFVNDSMLTLGTGYFPLTTDTQSCPKTRTIDRVICLDRYRHDRKNVGTREFQFRFWVENDTTLRLKAPHLPDAEHILYVHNHADTLWLDFRDAPNIHPHGRPLETEPVAYLPQPLTLNECPKFDSIAFYSGYEQPITLDSAGHFRLQGRLYDDRPFTGPLDSTTFDSLKAFLASARIPRDHYNFNTPADGHSASVRIFFNEEMYGFNGGTSNHYRALKTFHRWWSKVVLRLCQPLLQTDRGLVDTSGKRIVYYFRGKLISRPEIPKRHIRWGGWVHHRLYLLDVPPDLTARGVDHIFFVHPTNTSGSWTDDDGNVVSYDYELSDAQLFDPVMHRIRQEISSGKN